jgi:tRNA A-37 threonylcarbamoyl transferase component Bud32
MDVDKLISVSLGTCTLEQIIGRGGMGAVYLAQQARPVRTVAVKVLIPANTYDPDQQRIFLERFRREADTVARLEHKNILPIYEYAEAVYNATPLAYLVMPFIRGGTLRERIDEKRRSGSHFDLTTVADFISQVADALSYAHSLGVVHRDIKPANLLFHQDGRLLLSDFGIVRLQTLPSLTSVGSFLGTAEYASPEQISTSEIDFRSDIYSLGTILYELLAGSVPYSGNSPFAVMARKLSEPVPALLGQRSDLSPAIEAIVMKALAREPADRYQAATLLAADLRAAAAHSSALRLNGDASNSERTVAERPWGVAAPVVTRAYPPRAQAQAPTQRAPGLWPAQAGVGVSPPGIASTPPLQPATGQAGPQFQGLATGGPTYRESRRLFYYVTALVTLLLQFLVFVLVVSPSKDGLQTVAMLGVLIGSGINLLALAAAGFTAVIRSRPVRRFLARGLIVALLAPVLSGILINLGGRSHSPNQFIAYIILLCSNLYALRQLGRTDAAREQVLVAPVHWRPAIIGALTGLLPLVIILVFALETFFAHLKYAAAPLLAVLGMLFVVFIGAPTPGAVLAIRLYRNMRFPDLLRSSAIAGMLMFTGASLLVVTWALFFPGANHSQLKSGELAAALLIIIGIFAVLGAMRAMLDSWIYQRVRTRRGQKP